MSDIAQAHDSLFKDFLSDKEIARDFLKIHLPRKLQKHCDLSTITLQNGSFIGRELKQRFSDVLYRARIKGEDTFLYTLIEHQSTAERMLPLRILQYELDILQQYYKQTKCQRLPEIVSLVFYRGPTTPYPYSLDLLECFERQDKKRRGNFPRIPTLIDVGSIPDNVILTHGNVALLEILQKYVKTKDLCEFMEKVMMLLKQYPLSVDRKKRVFHYLLNEGQCANQDQFIDMVHKRSPEDGEQIMTVAQQLRQEGELKQREKIATRMLRAHKEIDEIVEITDFNPQQIEALRKTIGVISSTQSKELA